MPLPRNDTLVSFPNGVLSERATILSITVDGNRILLLTDITPFHPVDPRWPDQGPDRGTVTWGDTAVPVVDCVVGGTDGTTLFVGEAVPVCRGEPGWAFVVVHVLLGGTAGPVEGDEVVLSVDPARRSALSAGHTGCHVAALALNAALEHRWRKPVSTDGLGNPDFDQLAIVSSRIMPNGAVDRYRIGKSLRKRGFDGTGLGAELPAIVTAANRSLVGWVATGAPIDVVAHGRTLTDLREWVCVLPEGTQRIPCGGTHLRSLRDVATITVGLRYDEPGGGLTMETEVQLAD